MTHADSFTWGHSTEMSTQEIGRLEIVSVRLLRSPPILLLAAIGAKLIGPYGGVQVDKHAIERESCDTE